MVFFTARAGSVCGGSGPAVNELYVRIGGTRTLSVSESPLSIPGEKQEAIFAGASLDGSRVFFVTSQPLVDGDIDSGRDLYEAEITYDSASNAYEVTRLTQASHGDGAGPGGAGVLGVARVSEDGSHVYFVAEGTLTGPNNEGVAPVEGSPNLYVYERTCPGGGSSCASPAEHTSFVGTLATSDEADWMERDERPAQATSPDGRFLVFQSSADLTPDQAGLDEAGQVFEYDAQTGALIRVSRGQGGYNNDGHSNRYPATIPLQTYERAPPTERFTRMAMSNDGSRVVFSSEDALTPLALNGFNNVYEYHDKQVSLISDGHDMVRLNETPAVELIGIDGSGQDVYFRTADALVPQDTDTLVDLYDARIDGGFAPVTPLAPCAGDSCQGAVGGPPTLLSPLTSSVAGEPVAPPIQKAATKGAVKPAKHKSKKRKKNKKSKRKVRKSKGMSRAGRGR